MRQRSSCAVALALLFVGIVTSQIGCSANTLGSEVPDGGDQPPLQGLVSLTISPQSASLTVDNLGTPKTQAYVATGRFESGEERDVTSEINWKLDNAAIGTVARGVFGTSNQAGGSGTITAYSGSAMATAQITVIFQPILKDSAAPADASTKLPPTAQGTVMAPNSPAIIYPSNNTMFPRNLYKIRFEWSAGTGNNLFRLEYKSAQLNLSVYTTSTNWTPDATQWGYIANTNAGGSATWTVYGINSAAPGNVYRSNPVTLHFSKNSVDGAIYYWSTTVAGVRRATVSDSAPADFLTPANTGKCVACHTVSRNGERLAADIGGNILGVYNVKDRAVVVNPTQAIPMAWTTFNPDNSRIVTASKGVLTLRDGNTGAPINVGGNNGVIPIPVMGTAKFATMPDWSVDGKTLTFAYSASNKDRGIAGSSIATMQFANDTFSNFKVIVQSTGTADSKFYPAFSWDNKWIAFASTSSGSSDKNDLARLMIVPADGSAAAIDLGVANTMVNNMTQSGAAAQLANTMPTWAPTLPGDTMFVAFNSYRAYATVYAKGAYNQLWVVGIDPAKLPGLDPSFSAFHLPFQGATEDTHRAFWVKDVLAPPPPPPPPACAPNVNDDCTATTCCSPNYCNSNGGSGPYICAAQIG